MGWIKKNLAPMPPSDWKKKAGLIPWYKKPTEEETEKPKKTAIKKKTVAKKPTKTTTKTAEEKPKKRKSIPKISKKKKERIKNGGSEKALFEAVWKSRADKNGYHWCEICGCEIKEPRSWCFSHNLSKGRYPEFRLYDKNITLVCSETCHRENDKQNAGRDAEIIQALTSKK